MTKENLIKLLKERRIQLGLSQSKVAEMMGTKQPNIRRLERGNIDFGWDFLQRLTIIYKLEMRILKKK